MSDNKTLNGLLKGLGWIFSMQKPDGGWSPEVGRDSSDLEGTGHVIFTLSDILGIERYQKRLRYSKGF